MGKGNHHPDCPRLELKPDCRADLLAKLDTMSGRLAMLDQKDEALRELLTVLRNEAEMLDRMGYRETAGPAMHAAAERLGKILDGEA